MTWWKCSKAIIILVVPSVTNVRTAQTGLIRGTPYVAHTKEKYTNFKFNSLIISKTE
ncbi:hypothetical protein PF008_g7106 [Phytophthora fragariae]|uniref:Pectate lyase n=1 Tax=Phytophthora fragariae TaxID=53985 RepID=A0A6G0S583_9STRA|nr:hypothetical protein PF008_g7106 [Phytophthora fragariae]